MKPITIFKAIAALGVALGLAGCAVDLRGASAADIEKLVSVESHPNNPNRAWSAPELQVSHFRLRFYGYDTVYYRLTAVRPDPPSGPVAYLLVIDANYGGLVRHYDTVKLDNGAVYPTAGLRHEIVRCQIFGDMADTCLYRDRAELALSQEQLEAGRSSGLTLTLASADKDYERIDLPAHYIDGLLLAVHGQGSPR